MITTFFELRPHWNDGKHIYWYHIYIYIRVVNVDEMYMIITVGLIGIILITTLLLFIKPIQMISMLLVDMFPLDIYCDLEISKYM